MPVVSNVVTHGNGAGTKNVLKGTVSFGLSLVFSLLSSRRYYCSESKTILYLDTVYHKFLLYVSIEINTLKHGCFRTQTNLIYLGLVYVTMITGTHSERRMTTCLSRPCEQRAYSQFMFARLACSPFVCYKST